MNVNRSESGSSATREAASPLIELTDLTVRLGDRIVLAHLSATIWPDEFVGIIGPNGSGKSTLLRMILGLIRPASGEIRFRGMPLGRGNPRVGYCPQVRSFDPDLPITGREFVGLGVDGHRWGIGLPDARRDARIDQALEAVGVSHLGDAPLGQLSGGEQQRLGIAQALLGDPSLLLLDEPLASLDVRGQGEIINLVDQIRRQRHLAVLFVTHGVNPLLGVMDRVWYLAGGRAAIGPVREVIRADVLSDLYGSPIEVFEVEGRLFVSSPDEWAHHPGEGGKRT